ncbi:alpha-xenorhabdolysin family binary toxin subunit B [Pseudomonas sp. NBRC 111124]|uniref:alpha-xenorhabdolysin family binary toxin subunit B n=1 Tax=Pseudomonas sp. NBRC 111124 TaxID=1661039 RepID=UPI0015A740B5|nr:alpha-xenorhabdolysin family binary toxin subunit B [Pseudomonas sp. NBRC 111124]
MDMKMDELPDVKAMLDIETRMNQLYFNGAAVMLAAVRERLQDLVTLVEAGNDALREKVAVSLVELNRDLDDALPQLDEQALIRTRQELYVEVSDITEAIGQVRDYRSPDVLGFKQAHEADVVKLCNSAAGVEKLLADQTARLEEVDALLQTLDQSSVRKALRNTIPEEGDVDALLKTFKDPTISAEMIKAALSKLNKHLDLLEGGRRFANVVAARKRLSDARAEQERTLDHLRQQLDQAQQTTGQFNSVQELLEKRAPWLEEASKFINAWQVHESALNASSTSALESALRQARDYLLALRRRFEAV